MKGTFLSGNPAPRTALWTARAWRHQGFVCCCLAIGLLSIVGCGQKGPLTLPRPELQLPAPSNAPPAEPTPPEALTPPMPPKAPAAPVTPTPSSSRARS
ncbi:MAG: LPS translocon maturation chaperone LptM [Burkholderiaceae bacterium]